MGAPVVATPVGAPASVVGTQVGAPVVAASVGAPVAAQVGVQIRFMLVNANTDKEITNVDLNTNGTFSLSNLPTTALNIAANVTSTTSIGSVVFDIDGRLGYRRDTTVPFALCSESKGNFQSCGSMLGVGSHVVKATVRRKSDGSVLDSKTISFQGK